jgi:hypothetical protein
VLSLGSSIVQLYECLCSRRACSDAGFSSKNGDRAWVYYRRAAFCCAFFCGQKDLIQRIFIKKCFLFTMGSVYRVKRFTTGREITFRWWRRGWNGGAEVVETTAKRLLCCWFRRTGIRHGTSVSVLMEVMSRNKCFFSVSNITCFTFYIHLWPIYWLSIVIKRQDQLTLLRIMNTTYRPRVLVSAIILGFSEFCPQSVFMLFYVSQNEHIIFRNQYSSHCGNPWNLYKVIVILEGTCGPPSRIIAVASPKSFFVWNYFFFIQWIFWNV